MSKIKKIEKSEKMVTSTKDYLNFTDKDVKKIDKKGKTEEEKWRRWWMHDEENIGQATEQIILKIEKEQSSRYTSFVNWCRIYGNYEAMAWSNYSFAGAVNKQNDGGTGNPLRLNVIQSCIDAAAAKIAKDEPQPYFITSGSTNYFDKLKAAKCTRYVKGILQQCKVHEKSNSQFRDAEVIGTGFLHFFYNSDDDMQCDWVPSIEVRVSDYDGLTKQPRSIHRVRMMSREMLISKFPDKEEIIDRLATSPTNRLSYFGNNIVDMVRVKESWHLRSSDKSGDGVYCFTVNEECLCYQKYDLDLFPIIPFRWMDKMLGFWGRSVTEEIYALQMSLDDLLNVAAESYGLVGFPYWTAPEGAGIIEDHIASDFIARLITYRGTQPPQLVTPNPLPDSFMPWVMWHIDSMYKIVGISQASATSNNQLGPDASGAAIRELVDIETSRFSQIATSWENNTKNIAEVVLAITKEYAKTHPDLKVTYVDKHKRNFEYNFADVVIDNFTIGCDVVSRNPDKVAGLVQTVNDYVERNWITPERAMELETTDPDIREEVRRKTSSLDLTELRLSQMVEEGVRYTPEPYMDNLPQCINMSRGIYNMLVADGCPEDRLDLVRNWILDLVRLQTDPQYLSIQQAASPASPQEQMPQPTQQPAQQVQPAPQQGI